MSCPKASIVNYNQLNIEELAVVNPDVRKGTARSVPRTAASVRAGTAGRRRRA